MLEAKICEAGPGDKRPNPGSLTAAIKRLQQEARIKTIPKQGATDTPFYAPHFVATNSPSFTNLLTIRRHLYHVHKSITERKELCGDVLEQIVDAALERSGVASFLSRFPDQNLPPDRPLDFVVEIAGVKWGGELKNLREWLYPDSLEIWSAISKCCELNAVPLLITRKLPYVTYLFFGKAGVVGYQTHFQFFHPTAEPELARVKAVDGLGYKDIRCTLDPDANMIRLFQSTLPRIGADFASRFQRNRDLLLHFADTGQLGDRNLHPTKRSQIFAEAWRQIVGSPYGDDLHV